MTLAPGAPADSVDAAHIEGLLLVNLLENALSRTPRPRTPVDLSATVEGEELRFSRSGSRAGRHQYRSGEGIFEPFSAARMVRTAAASGFQIARGFAQANSSLASGGRAETRCGSDVRARAALSRIGHVALA